MYQSGTGDMESETAMNFETWKSPRWRCGDLDESFYCIYRISEYRSNQLRGWCSCSYNYEFQGFMGILIWTYSYSGTLLKVKGAILIGIIAAALLGIPLGVTTSADSVSLLMPGAYFQQHLE